MILDDIIAKKQKDLENIKQIEFLEENLSPITNFYQSLAKNKLSIIGEIKKASPSKGLIKSNFNPVEIAKQYKNSVDAISVLTEEHFFGGKNEYLTAVHEAVHLPILRKDFIIDSIQIKEARIIGASAILLITSILKPKQLKEYIELAKQLGLDSLIEIHNKEEIKIALDSGAKIIGINNRDLNTFNVDLNTTLRLREFISNDIIVVSESGINTVEDIKLIRQADINAILVGESFMRADNIQEKIMEFKKAYDTSN